MPVDPIELAVFQSAVHSIAEEMGAALRRTAFSPNIKERRDYSCAVFDADGRSHRHGRPHARPPRLHAHVRRAAVNALTLAPRRHRHPQRPLRRRHPPPRHHHGHARLPRRKPRPKQTTSPLLRSHPRPPRRRRRHVPRLHGPRREIFQEGLRIPPVNIVTAGELNHADPRTSSSLNVRTPERTRRRPRRARSAPAASASSASSHLVAPLRRTHASTPLATDLLDYSERLVRAELRTLPARHFTAEDFLDNDGVTDTPSASPSPSPSTRTPPPSTSTSPAPPRRSPAASTPSAPSPSPPASTSSAACSATTPPPPPASCARSPSARPEGTIVNARPPAAVAGGNVETSQRIVDVLLRALAQAAPHPHPRRQLPAP